MIPDIWWIGRSPDDDYDAREAAEEYENGRLAYAEQEADWERDEAYIAQAEAQAEADAALEAEIAAAEAMAAEAEAAEGSGI